MRVLERQEVDDVDLVRIGLERLRDDVGRELSPRRRPDLVRRHSREGSRGRRLHPRDVRLCLARHPVTAPHERVHGDLVRHRPAGDEDRGLLAGELCRAVLQAVHRGVVAVPVVTDLGVRHGAAHRLGRLRDGVGAKIDRHRLSILSSP